MVARRTPVQTADVAELARRRTRAIEQAEAAVARANRLFQDSRLDSRHDIGSWLRFFVVRGLVGEAAVKAIWFRDALGASAALLDRARLIVAMGETFRAAPLGPVVPAGLDQPIAALLTCIRACDRVTSIRFGPLPGQGAVDVRDTLLVDATMRWLLDPLSLDVASPGRTIVPTSRVAQRLREALE